MQSVTWAGLLLLVLQWAGPELSKLLQFWREQRTREQEHRLDAAYQRLTNELNPPRRGEE